MNHTTAAGRSSDLLVKTKGVMMGGPRKTAKRRVVTQTMAGVAALLLGCTYGTLPLRAFGQTGDQLDGDYLAQVFHIEREILQDDPQRTNDVCSESRAVEDAQALRLLLRCSASRVHSIGLSPLSAGQSSELHRREPIEPTSELETKGVEFAKRGGEFPAVGEKVTFMVNGLRRDSIDIQLSVESVRLSQWIDYGSGEFAVRLPIFARHSATTNVVVPANTWYVSGGAILDLPGGNRESFFLFRILERDAADQWGQEPWYTAKTTTGLEPDY